MKPAVTESGVRRNRAQVLTTTWVASAQSYHRLKTTQVIPAQSSYTGPNSTIRLTQIWDRGRTRRRP
jgi:hypothetical protein